MKVFRPAIGLVALTFSSLGALAAEVDANQQWLTDQRMVFLPEMNFFSGSTLMSRS